MIARLLIGLVLVLVLIAGFLWHRARGLSEPLLAVGRMLAFAALLLVVSVAVQSCGAHVGGHWRLRAAEAPSVATGEALPWWVR